MGCGKIYYASDVVASLLRQLCRPSHIVPDRLRQGFERINDEPNYKLELDDVLEALREPLGLSVSKS